MGAQTFSALQVQNLLSESVWVITVRVKQTEHKAENCCAKLVTTVLRGYVYVAHEVITVPKGHQLRWSVEILVPIVHLSKVKSLNMWVVEIIPYQ